MLKMLFSSSKDILKNLQGLFIGLPITTSWLVFLTTVSFLHKEVFYPSPPQLCTQDDSPLKSIYLERNGTSHLPQTFLSLPLDFHWNFISFKCLPYLAENYFILPTKSKYSQPLVFTNEFSILSISCRSQSQAYFSTTQLVWLSRFKHILN